MAAYVLLTVSLRQRGSAESKDLEGVEEVDEDPRAHRDDPDAPWPVRRGGWWLVVYEHSLSLAFGLLFLLSFGLHAVASWRGHLEELADHGQPAQGLAEFLASARFWFESFQNWQSEFLAVAAIVVSRSSCASGAHPNRNPWPRRTRRWAHDGCA